MASTIEVKNSSPTSVMYDANKKIMAVSLPQDVILFQILTRVPTKSVIRFKCVSKEWNSFTMSDRFKEMHNHNLLKDHHLEDKSLLFCSKHEATFFTIDCESPPVNAPCHRRLPFEVSPPGEGEISILTSYHGLVCLHIRDNYHGNYIILWNPLTTEYKRLSEPPNPHHMECYLWYGSGYGLYYSSCEDDYKLIVVTRSCNVYIYSLKSDSWRKLNKKAPFPEAGWLWRPGFHLCENIYFQGPSIAQELIRFDTTAERFHKIETPPKYDNTYYPHFAATVHRGSIHLCVKYNIFGLTGFKKSTCIEMWKFNAHGDIWNKVVTYHLEPNADIVNMSPLHLMSNGNWLMRDYKDGGRTCQVELMKKYIEDKDGHDEYKLFYSNVEGYYEEVRYTETFVSPNRYMK